MINKYWCALFFVEIHIYMEIRLTTAVLYKYNL